MSDRQSPTLRRRRLAQELRRLRSVAGKTSTEVARVLEWAPGKLTRMERNEGKRYDPHDIRLLCGVYDADETTTEYLVQLARDGRLKGWWDPYDKMLSEAATTFFGLETEAAKMLVFEPLAVPGLLQIEAYAGAIIAGASVNIPDEELATRVKIRMRRQEALRQSPALEIVAVIDEAVLHRMVGGDEVMRAQVEHLIEQARRPNVTIQVIPYKGGAHAAMSGSFNIVQFAEPGDLDAVFVDLVAGQMFIEEPTEVRRYHAAFLHLVAAAASPANTLEMLTSR